MTKNVIMMDERKPDENFNIEVDGYTVAAYSFGRGEEVLFCLNGGPGLPSDKSASGSAAPPSRWRLTAKNIATFHDHAAIFMTKLL